MHRYNEKLREQKVKSLSRICNGTFLAVICFLIAYIRITVSAFGVGILCFLILGLLMILRTAYIYVLIADRLLLKLLYFGMMLMVSVGTVLGFFMISPIAYLFMLCVMLLSFPFLFYKLSSMKK